MTSFLAFVSALTMTLVLTHWLLSSGRRLLSLDHPNERSLHSKPTPRGGGIAIASAILLAGVALGLTYTSTVALGSVAVAVASVVVVSFLDDRMRLPPTWRMGVHITAGGILVGSGLWPLAITLPGFSLPWPATLGMLFALVYIVWMINLYNFMDGMDGFAGGMAVIGFGACALLAWLEGAELLAALCFTVVGANLGFLWFNFPPAKIFMGDVGSSLLGLLAAVCTLWADRKGIFPLWVGVLVFSPFVVDATYTLIRRLSLGEKVWQAHKSHLYQRLVQSGWGHRRTVMWEYALMLACACSALAAVSIDRPIVQWSLLCLWLLAYTIVIRLVPILESRGRTTAT